MSFQATTWAISQRTGKPTVKLVLLAAANYADDQGKCWPKQTTLADDTEMSVDSVQRHLRELERLGLVYRTPRRRDSGTRMPDFLFLLMHDEARAIAAAHGWSADDLPDDSDEDEDNPSPEDSLSQAESDPHMAADCGHAGSDEQGRTAPATRPQLCGLHTDKQSLEQSIDPLPPINPQAASQGSAGEEPGTESLPSKPAPGLPSAWLDDWKRFEEIWPFDRDEPRDPCRRILQRTPPSDRTKILEAAKSYLHECRQKGRKRVSAKRFLREKIWEPFVSKPKPGKITNHMVFVRQATPAWDAWLAHKRADGTLRTASLPTTMHRGDDGKLHSGWWFPSMFPPGHGGARDGPPAAAAAAPR